VDPRRLLPPLAVAATLVPAAAAAAAEPTMPLAEVRPGMACTGLSAIRGSDPQTFDVEVLDVIGGDPGARAPRILIRVSGPAIDATGIGPGFSGSPVVCGGRIAGAISEGIGEYGGKVALATPIEAVLGEPVDPPPGTSPGTRTLRRARPLAAPLTVGGLSGPVARALSSAAARAGRVLYAAPALPRQAVVPPALRPGSAMAVGLATGDVTLSAVGTVAYVDADRVWAFGHPLDGVGRRSLFLQGAYVHTIVNNPVASQDLTTYKLASPLGDLGTLTNDAPEAVVGRLGALPRGIELAIFARDADTGRQETTRARIADEAGVGLPTGASSLSQVAPAALAQAAYTILRGSPSRSSGRMCVTVTLAERRKPLRFCNTYAGGGGAGSAGAPMVADLAAAIGLLDGFKLGRATPTRMQVELGLRRGVRQAYLAGVRGPATVRRGATATVTLLLRPVGGGPVTRRRVRVRIPRSVPRGPRLLAFQGTPADAGGADLGDVLTLTLDDLGEQDDPGPASLDDLAGRFAALHRFDGIGLSVVRRDARPDDLLDAPSRPVLRDRAVRLSGQAALRVRIR
jgi:hypothetical protein